MKMLFLIWKLKNKYFFFKNNNFSFVDVKLLKSLKIFLHFINELIYN